MDLQKMRSCLEEEVRDFGGVIVREILFKAKRLDNGNWVDGNVFFGENKKNVRFALELLS